MPNHSDGVIKKLIEEQETLSSDLFERPSIWRLKREFGKIDAPEKVKIAALKRQIAWCLESSVRDILDRYEVCKSDDETLSLTEESREKLQLDLQAPNELPQIQSIIYYGGLLEKIDLLSEVQLHYANVIPNKHILRMSSLDQLTENTSKRLGNERFSAVNPNYDQWEKIMKLVVFGTIFISSVAHLWSWLDQKLF